MAALGSCAFGKIVRSSTVLHERLWTGKAPARLCVPAALIRNNMLPPLSQPWCHRRANMHASIAQAALSTRWLSAKGAGGVKGLPVEGKNAGGKKGKRGGVTVTAAEELHKGLLKHVEKDFEHIKRTPRAPQGWTRINIDEYVKRGEEGIIVVRKAFPDYIVDVVARPAVETMDEDMIDPEDRDNDMEHKYLQGDTDIEHEYLQEHIKHKYIYSGCIYKEDGEMKWNKHI